MIHESVIQNPPAYSQACVLADNLRDLLEQEFEQLKRQDLDAFDARQEEKNAVLQRLTELAGITGPDSADALGPEWDAFKQVMGGCRDLHRRNEILIHRKLDAIRGALQSLEAVDPVSSVEMYDRLGKMARRPRNARGYTEA